MKLVAPALALALATSFTAPAFADQDPPSISVTGEASVSTPPDEAMIDAGVASEAKTAKQAAEANNVAMGKVLIELKSAGIDAKDVQTSRVSLSPQYSQPAPGKTSPATITGYRASNQVMVRIRNIGSVGDVLDRLVAGGANTIGNISFVVKDSSKLLDDARTQALADAKRKAEIYAKAAGVELGAPLDISEGGAVRPMVMRKMMAASADVAHAQIAPGETTLSVTVSATWAIKSAP